ncbi:MAG: ATP-grasp domain-containing protein [Agathobacter sp.]|nr:ATP-grasp domain-containing protein [Agathobacter sp.]
MNILLLSVGTRNKIVEYFKKTLAGRGKVVATDMSDIAPAIYEADKYYIVPPMKNPGYIDVILDICRKEEIDGVLSLIDPELSLLAKENKRFEEAGTKVIGSSYELCEMSLDKYEMYKWLRQHNYYCAKTYIDRELFYKDLEAGEISFPVFVKPVKGSASVEISEIHNQEILEVMLKYNDSLMIQEFLQGQEIGADVYIDMISGEVVSVFTKRKLRMRAGETDKSVAFIDDRLIELIKKFVCEAGYRGQIDIDIFDIDGKYYISEVNPRFGGGYPHAFECGVNNMEMICNNLQGKPNESVIEKGYDTGVYMMKYNEIGIKRG